MQVEYNKVPTETLRMELLRVVPGLYFINVQLSNSHVISEKILIY